MVACVYNSLIVSLNTREQLPRLIILMLDKDLIQDVGYYGNETDDILAKNIEWLFRQIEIMVKRRHAELLDKKPDAMYGSDPKIVVVDMLKHPLQFSGKSNIACCN